MSAPHPSLAIEIEPLISYPKKAEAGKSYVMTVDLRQRVIGAEWPYDAEEYAIYCMLDAGPLFKSEPIGDHCVVLHRFGGTYGPAMFILTAAEKEMRGNMRLSLISESGMPVDVIEIPGIQITKEQIKSRPSDVSFVRESTVGTHGAQHTTPSQVPDPVPGAPRGFRIRHTLKLAPSRQPAGEIVWSPDGKILLVPSDNVQLWDAETGQQLRTLRTGPRKPEETVGNVIYSPNGALLAVVDSHNYVIEIWDTKTWSKLRVLEGHQGLITSLAWSPDGRLLASTSAGDIKLWEVESGGQQLSYIEKRGSPLMAAWSPDGQHLACGNSDKSIRIWDGSKFNLELTLEAHTEAVYSVAWSPDGKILASGGGDHAIRIWDMQTGVCKFTLNKHKNYVIRLSFSADGRLLASKSSDGMTMLWRCDKWEWLATFDDHSVGAWASSPAFHPTQYVLATLGEEHKVVHVWDLDLDTLLTPSAETPDVTPSTEMESYAAAKVVILGDTGVGKSGLANRLVKQSFFPTTSTHGAQIWLFDSLVVTAANDARTRRDIFLWDLAGQPNYHLLHQLELRDVALALVLFDAHHEADPFASVRYWDRALRQVERQGRDFTAKVRKILVAARADRGGVGLTQERVQSLMQELAFDAFFETSAKEGLGTSELSDAIHRLIDWSRIPVTISPSVFHYAKDFLMAERDKGPLMATVDELYGRFLSSRKDMVETADLRSQFEVCIDRVASNGLVRPLRIDNYVLMQPEVMNSYASSIINAVREHPDGLASINEADVLESHFRIPSDERVNDRELEKIIVRETVEQFLKMDLALRVRTEGESLLVFPSLFLKENPDLSDPQGKEVVFTFEGVVQSIYATLAVSLSRNGFFTNKGMWKNVSTYASVGGGICGILLREVREGRGELTLFFSAEANSETKVLFDELVHRHLRQFAIPESIQRHLIIACSNCGTSLSDQVVAQRLARGFDWIACPVCDARISLPKLDDISQAQTLDVEREQSEAPPVASAFESSIESELREGITENESKVPADELAQLAQAGVQALVGLRYDPGIQTLLVTLRSHIEECRKSIDVLSYYMTLHDLLHTLQFQCYDYIRVLLSDAKNKSGDASIVDNLRDSSFTLTPIVDQLDSLAKRLSPARIDTDWIGGLSDSLHKLNLSLESGNLQDVETALRPISRELATRPPRIAVFMLDTVRRLHLNDIISTLAKLRESLVASRVTGEIWTNFDRWIGSLNTLEKNFALAMKELDAWQNIAQELRLIDASGGEDLSGLQSLWSDLRIMIELACRDIRNDQTNRLLEDIRRVDAAIVADDPNRIRQCFTRVRSHSRYEFAQVLLTLNELCEELGISITALQALGNE
jgi:small GTP-binding protein